MKKKIEINDVIDAIVETANELFNQDKWRFDWDTLEPGNIVLNCRSARGFSCVQDVDDAIGYCRDVANVVENALNKFEGEEWYCHSEANVWDNDSNCYGDFWPNDDEEAKLVTCVQCQFFND